MEEKRKTRVVMLRNHLNINSVNTEEPEKSTELKIRYADSPRLRDKVVDFVEEVCKATSRDIFHHICGRCGGCCSRENILVRGGDIFRISMHLGISEEEFVSEYIDDAGTWNKFDGYLKKNPENQCMFLEKVPSGKTRCKIHSVRPAQCREYQPMYVNCQKDIGKLINHLREIKIENDELTVFSCKNGESGLKHSDEFASKVTIKLEGELKGLFEEVIKITFEDGDEINKVQKMSRDAIELIQRFTEDLSNKMQEPDFEKQMEDLRTIVVRLEELIPFSRDGDQLLEELFVVFKRLEKLIQGKDEETAEEVDFSVKESLFESEKINLASINLFPGILSIDYSKAGENLSDSFLLSQNNNILASSRKLLKEITKLENMELQRKITDYDPPCYLCGICCSFYAVEIQPEDILRLAENLGMAYEDFRK
ncbi:MAG: YkgJ family cysteine cluster protein, partial [Vulcanimicrobiota bacterium]